MSAADASSPSTDGDVSPISPATPSHPLQFQSEMATTDLNGGRGNPKLPTQTAVHVKEDKNSSAGGYESVPTEEPRTPSTLPRGVPTRYSYGSPPATKLTALRAWTYEFLVLFTSMFSFCAIVGLLRFYHNKPQPELALFNINTVVAIWSAVLRGTLLSTIAQVIGQLKWAWMKTPRPLRHVEHFDNASTGAWGSFKFLFFIWEPTPTLVGVLVVLASYGIGPFSQQAATTYACEIDSLVPHAARVSVAKQVSWSNAALKGNTPEMHAIALNSLVLGTDESDRNDMFVCETGNCTFTYTSVGICKKCVNVTSSLVTTAQGADGGGAFHFAGNQGFDLVWPPQDGRVFSMASDGLTTSILAFISSGCSHDQQSISCGPITDKILERPSDSMGQEIEVVAINNTLFPCFRSYVANVAYGNLKENVVSEVPLNLAKRDSRDWVNGNIYGAMTEPCKINGEDYDYSNISKAPRDHTWVSWEAEGGRLHEAPLHCFRSLDANMPSSIVDFLDVTLAGKCSTSSLKTNLPPGVANQISCGERWWINSLYKEGRMSFDTVSAAFENLAKAMTNHMRTKAEGKYTNVSYIEGTAKTTAVCIRVDWPWLMYPAALVMLTAGLLLTAYLQSCRDRGGQPIWKATPLPLLFYSVQADHPARRDDAAALPLLQLAELEALADNTVVRFSTDARSPGFIVEKGVVEEEGGAAKEKMNLLGMHLSPVESNEDGMGA